ncbi:MAG: recombinase family protein [Candidatus Solibacter usitatus]|nr:recombinase family protein [Candidatus Solibacter usitatus]
MRNIERLRETLTGAPTHEYFESRSFSGWKPVAIIWEREIEMAGPQPREETPFGTQIDAASDSLVENRKEREVLLRLMDSIVQDKRISQVASELNTLGYRTREGKAWTPVSVYALLPRVIELGPSVFPTAEWAQRRHQLTSAA